jgi:hypothetical protein
MLGAYKPPIEGGAEKGARMKKVLIIGITLAVSVFAGAQAHDRHAAEAAESSHVRGVPGGTTIDIAGSYDAVFEGLVTYLKKSGYSVDEANKESGLVATSMEIDGGWKQTGKRLVFSVIKDKARNTAIRVAVSIQKRMKLISTEPWGDPKVDDKASADLAHKVQTELVAQLAQN